MKDFIIKDSGKREAYSTGAVRDTNENKIKWHLLPVEALKRIAIHYTNGAKKYDDNNWKKGIPTERFIESACRHWNQYLLGEKDEDHLSATVFNIFGIIYNEEKGLPDQEKDNIDEEIDKYANQEEMELFEKIQVENIKPEYFC
jgi:hypothetical protein